MSQIEAEPTPRSSLRYYRGHRSHSFYPDDINEIVEIRARQRTFDGAYGRSALGNLGYSLTILRLFDKRFAKIGIVYAILAGLLYVLAYFRHQHARHDFADRYKERAYEHAIPTIGQHGKHIFGRPFVTAGWIVAAVAVVVAVVEIALLVLILTIDLSDLAAEQGHRK
ncbi:hypothetical protein WOLCODRAFT_138232 [Wolfiporia cocos MD-104 SS10]|uniref:DUF202 domain-containing protein n=1 Tax=Wolfiporia cocos (strain MD-104) TaxID=742152 RepID=A0A2H3K434_WOLCO|nr:hypothetical protein WOLCODRAFT_138232 [Wolfiporia cocos MD-104 SS10]